MKLRCTDNFATISFTVVHVYRIESGELKYRIYVIFTDLDITYRCSIRNANLQLTSVISVDRSWIQTRIIVYRLTSLDKKKETNLTKNQHCGRMELLSMLLAAFYPFWPPFSRPCQSYGVLLPVRRQWCCLVELLETVKCPSLWTSHRGERSLQLCKNINIFIIYKPYAFIWNVLPFNLPLIRYTCKRFWCTNKLFVVLLHDCHHLRGPNLWYGYSHLGRWKYT